MFAAAAMSLSSFCVVTNALRLNLFDMYSIKRDRRCKNAVSGEALGALINDINSMQEEKTMTKTMLINGMMCGNCKKHVEKALGAVGGVSAVEVNLEEKKAVVTLSAEVSDDVLKNAVVEEGYEVVAIS